MVCLAINLILSGAFVTWTKQLAASSEKRIRLAKQQRRNSKGASEVKVFENQEKIETGRRRTASTRDVENGELSTDGDGQFERRDSKVQFADLPNAAVDVQEM